MSTTAPPFFVRRDLDGFFGLFIDNLVQLLLIVALCGGLCGMSGEAAFLMTAHVLPGAAVSILFGNLFYAWQARRVAWNTGRTDITALPYGINTPSMFVYVFFVMAPVYQQALAAGRAPVEAARFAWLMGLIACLGSGLLEFAGAFVAESIRRRTPRAALLSTLAGIAIGFIAMSFALQIFQRPLVSMLPLAVVLIIFFAQAPFPWHLPGGFVAVVLGTAVAWGLTLLKLTVPAAPAWLISESMDPAALTAAARDWSWHWPIFVGNELVEILQQPSLWIGHLAVIVPMGLFNIVGSLQNIESAEAAGDRFDTRSSLAANGIGTLAAAFFGSCFPTTIYIGHPGWKQLGARTGYSTLNGLVITVLCLSGSVGIVKAIVPLESGIAILLWIGIIITAQAFSSSPAAHAPAVAVGLFPAIAAWGQTVVAGAFLFAGGKTMQDLLVENPGTELSGYLLHGLLAIERGYIFTCMILAAVSVFLIERKFFTAGIWMVIAAGCAALGLTHAYQLKGNAIDFLFVFAEPAAGAYESRAWPIAIGYLMMSAVFVGYGIAQKRAGSLPRVGH